MAGNELKQCFTGPRFWPRCVFPPRKRRPCVTELPVMWLQLFIDGVSSLAPRRKPVWTLSRFHPAEQQLRPDTGEL